MFIVIYEIISVKAYIRLVKIRYLNFLKKYHINYTTAVKRTPNMMELAKVSH